MLPTQTRLAGIRPLSSAPRGGYGVLSLDGDTGSAQTLIGTRTLGGSGSDVPSVIGSDVEGNICIGGRATSPDFPVTKALYSQLPEPALRVSSGSLPGDL
jgi:hypothetical protein